GAAARQLAPRPEPPARALPVAPAAPARRPARSPAPPAAVLRPGRAFPPDTGSAPARRVRRGQPPAAPSKRWRARNRRGSWGRRPRRALCDEGIRTWLHSFSILPAPPRSLSPLFRTARWLLAFATACAVTPTLHAQTAPPPSAAGPPAPADAANTTSERT